MKFKFKALSLILSLVMLLCAFASCANNTSSESESDTEKITQTENTGSEKETNKESNKESNKETNKESEKEEENKPENKPVEPIDHVGKMYRFVSEKFILLEEDEEALLAMAGPEYEAEFGKKPTVEDLASGFSNARAGFHNDVYFASASMLSVYKKYLSEDRGWPIFEHGAYQLESTGRITGPYISDIEMALSTDKKELAIKIPIYLSNDGDINPAMSYLKSYSLITYEVDESFVGYDRMATAGKTYVSTSAEIRWDSESEKEEFYTLMGKTHNAYLTEFNTMIENKNYPYTYVFDANGVVNVFGDTPCGMKLYKSAHARTEFNGYIKTYHSDLEAEKGYGFLTVDPYMKMSLSRDGKTLTAEVELHDDLDSVLVLTCTYDEEATALKTPTLSLKDGYFLGSYAGIAPDFTVDKIQTESGGEIVFECRHDRSEEGGPDWLVDGLPDEFGDYYLRVAIKPHGEYGWAMAEFEFYVEQYANKFMEKKLGINDITTLPMRVDVVSGNIETTMTNLEAGKTYVCPIIYLNKELTSFSCHIEDDDGNWVGNVTSPDYKPMRLFDAHGNEIKYDMWDDQDIILEYDVSGNKYFTLNAGEGCIFLITPTENIDNFVLSAF